MDRHVQGAAWLDQRLRDLLCPQDIPIQCRLFTTFDYEVPPALAGLCTPFLGIGHVKEEEPIITESEAETFDCIVIFCDRSSQEQVSRMQQLIMYVDDMGCSAPPVLWVHHTVASEFRTDEDVLLASQPVVTQMLEIGLDGIVAREPEGFDLVLEIQAFAAKVSSFTEKLSDHVNERSTRTERAHSLRQTSESILWDYLRVRVAPTILPVDYSLPRGELRAIDGFAFGPVLGRGAFGTVYLLEPQSEEADRKTINKEVVKVVDKSRITDVQELRCMQRMLDVMRLVSGAEHGHPNVIQLYQQYHSPTHLLLRMEFGGSEDLYRRLSYRQVDGERCRPMSSATTLSVIHQAVLAVHHLHTGPQVCHRDIKPENFIVMESGDSLILKLTDFDLALVHKEGAVCRSPCGTLPFTAPEVVIEREYNGKMADVWSLAIMFFEVSCGIRSLERLLGLPTNIAAASAMTVMKTIRAGFDNPDSVTEMLQDNCRPEVRPYLFGMQQLLRDVLRISPVDRLGAPRIKAAVEQLLPADDA